MSAKFNVNDHVVYGKSGVCIITEIRALNDSSQDVYYHLKPINHNNSTVYVPIESDALVQKMRAVLTKEEIDLLLLQLKDKKLNWIDDKVERSEFFKKILREGNREELILLIECLYNKHIDRKNAGKRLLACDESALKLAEKLIEDEFSFVLDIPNKEVGDYIKNKLETK